MIVGGCLVDVGRVVVGQVVAASGFPPQVVAGQWPLPRSTSSLWPLNPASLMPMLLQTSKSGETR